MECKYDNSKEALAAIMREHGVDVLLGSRLKNFFRDYAPDVRKSRKNVVFFVIESGAAEVLKRNIATGTSEQEIAFKQAVKKVIDECPIERNEVESVMLEFTAALGWKINIQPQKLPVPLEEGQIKSSLAYELFCKSVIGSSHRRRGIPCEDSGIKADCGRYRIFAAADGHGDPNCLRSNIGSEVICRIASEKLEVFARTIEEQGWEETLFDEQAAKQRMEGLVRSIVGGWGEAVSQELEQNPLSEEELQMAPAYAEEYKMGDRTERMYGTTLIAGLQTESYLLLLQQGNGRCVVFDCNGEVSQPVPWDDRCIGTSTTSLCDSDAVQSFRHCVINLKENPVIACIAGTDGVEDSFPASMEKTHAYYRELLRYACENGVQALEEYLDGALSNLSADGSADDITVSGIIYVERVRPYLDSFAAKNRLVHLEDEVAFLESKVKSIEESGKLQHLVKKYKEADAVWKEAFAAHSAANTVYRRADIKYQNLSDKCNELEETIAAQERGVPKNELASETSSEYMEDLKKLILSPYALSRVKKEYKDRYREKKRAEEKLQEAKEKLQEAKKKLDEAKEKKKTAEAEYQDCKKRYCDFVKQRDEAKAKLDEERASLNKPESISLNRSCATKRHIPL